MQRNNKKKAIQKMVKPRILPESALQTEEQAPLQQPHSTPVSILKPLQLPPRFQLKQQNITIDQTEEGKEKDNQIIEVRKSISSSESKQRVKVKNQSQELLLMPEIGKVLDSSRIVSMDDQSSNQHQFQDLNAMKSINQGDSKDELVKQSHHEEVKIEIDEEYSSLKRIGEFLLFIGFQFNRSRRNIGKKNYQLRKNCVDISMIVQVIIMSIALIVYNLLVQRAVNVSAPPSYDELKRWLANNFTTGSIIFTFYGIIFTQIRNGWIYIVLFFIQAIPSSFYFLDLTYNTYIGKKYISLPQPDYVITAYISGLYYFWLIFGIIQNDIRREFGGVRHQVMITFVCFLIPSIAFGYPLYLVSTTNQINNQWAYILFESLSAPYVVFICLLWFYIHFKFFDKLEGISPAAKVFSSLSVGGTMILTVCVGLLLMSHTFSIDISYKYSMIENQEVKDEIYYNTPRIDQPTLRIDNGKAFYALLFFIFFTPAVTISITSLLANQVNTKLKLLLLPILGVLIPMFFTVPIAIMFDLQKTTQLLQPLQEYLFYGLPAIGLYVTTGLFAQQLLGKANVMTISSALCIFIIFPLIVIGKLMDTQTFDNGAEFNGALIIYILLLTLGGLVLLFFLIKTPIQLVQQWWKRRQLKDQAYYEEMKRQVALNQRKYFSLEDLFRFDLEDFGLWGNSCGYIITLTILVLMYYNRPAWVTDSQSGALLGLQFIIFLLFIYQTVSLRMRVVNVTIRQATSQLEKVTQLIEARVIRNKLIERQRRVNRTILELGLIYIPLISIIIALSSNKQNQKQQSYAAITVTIGVVLVTVIFQYFMYIKMKFEDFSKAAIPILIVFCWIFLYIPFGAIIPSARFYLSIEKEEYVDYERLVSGGIAVLMLLAIALISIIMHFFFRQSQMVKKFNFVGSKVIQKLADIHVKSDYYTLEILYNSMKQHGKDLTKQKLQSRKFINWRSIPDYEPDERFSKYIVNQETLDLLKKEEKRKKKPTKFQNCWKCFTDGFFKYVCCLCNDNQVYPDVDYDDNFDFEQKIENILLEARGHDGQRQTKEMRIMKVGWLGKKQILSFLSRHLKKLQFRPLPKDILEAVRRYDTPLNIHISQPCQQEFMNYFFFYFGYSKINNDPRRRYVDKQAVYDLCRLSGLFFYPDANFEESQSDSTYDSFGKPSDPQYTPINQTIVPKLFQKLGEQVFSSIEQPEKQGFLMRQFCLPLLIWNIPAFRPLYQHDWEYILYLLGIFGYKDEIEQALDLDFATKKEIEKQLGIVPLQIQKLNPDYELIPEEPKNFTLADLNEMINLWCVEFCKNLRNLVERFKEPDIWYRIKDKKSIIEYDAEGFERRIDPKDKVQIEKEFVLNDILRAQIGQVNLADKFYHKESPPWEDISSILLDELEKSENQFLEDEAEQKKVNIIRWNVTNTFFIIFKLLETYSISTLIFTQELDWGISADSKYGISFFNTLGPMKDSFNSIMIICCIASAIFVFLIYHSNVRVRSNHFGFSEGGLRPKYLCFDFFSVQFLNFCFFPGTFIFFKNMFDSYSCDYAIYRQRMYQQDAMKCLTQPHIKIMVVASIFLLIMYPLFSFLFPNTQVNNRSLDYRFEPTYLLFTIQVKLLIAGLSAFLPTYSLLNYQFGGIAILMGIQGLLAASLRPCYFDQWNIFESTLAFVCVISHVSAIINRTTNSSYKGWVFFIVMLIVLLVACIFWWYSTKQIQDFKEAHFKKPEENSILDDGAVDENKGKLELIYWKNLCDIENKYNIWLPKQMANREAQNKLKRQEELQKFQEETKNEEF